MAPSTYYFGGAPDGAAVRHLVTIDDYGPTAGPERHAMVLWQPPLPEAVAVPAESASGSAPDSLDARIADAIDQLRALADRLDALAARASRSAPVISSKAGRRTSPQPRR